MAVASISGRSPRTSEFLQGELSLSLTLILSQIERLTRFSGGANFGISVLKTLSIVDEILFFNYVDISIVGVGVNFPEKTATMFAAAV